MTKGQYHSYIKIYKKKLDELCSQIGIDAHQIKVYNKELFEKTDANTINNKLLEMYHAGFSFGKNYRTESRRYIEDLDKQKTITISIYKNATLEQNLIPEASAHDILNNMHNSFDVGVAYSQIFKKRMAGREFLDKLVSNDKIETIYKII
jgi:hypothetical protein